MLVTIDTPRGPRKVRVCDYCKTVCTTSRFCSGRCAREYVRGEVHTNSMENFWSLLKRSLKGTYVSVAPFHLQRYVDEQVHRFNHRKMDDGERFADVMGTVTGRRLTYRELTGQDGCGFMGLQ